MRKNLQELIGKTISEIETPKDLSVDGSTRRDDNIVITFSDGACLKLASWDYEGYASGIYKEII